MASPPPLPPRDSSQLPPPPPYSEVVESQGSLNSGRENPPRSSILDSKVPRPSSSQSLAPSRFDSDGRRTLLLVYIHGFYGNDQSFQSFPAHVHNVLRETLSETHAVYSKVYPRYKTYKSIEVARDNFSAWLEPHESPTTDVILVGHSMGGLLAAEIVLMVSRLSSSGRYKLGHSVF
jgi:pimeloyl-ACP methyl ester carboxylesterase